MITSKGKGSLDCEIVYIPVKDLSVIWVQSQRPYNPNWAAKIASEFDIAKFDPLVVTKPNGQGVYHIIEGQHRRHGLEMWAAKLNPSGDGSTEQAPCRIVAEADPARAADVFRGINKGRKPIPPVYDFKVAVTAGNEPEKSIDGLIRAEGYRVDVSKISNTIAAVSALKIIYTRHSAFTLSRTLRTIRALWGEDAQAVKAPILLGFGIFMHEFGTHVNVPRLKKNVADKFSPFEFLTAAKAWRNSTQERIDVAMSELLRREYNKGAREDQKLKRKQS